MDYNYNDYREYAETPHQQRVIDALISEGSQVKAAKILGCAKNNVCVAWERVRKNAVRRGYDPKHHMVHPLPDNLYVKRLSTQYKDGKVNLQWVIGEPDKGAQLQAVINALEGYSQSLAREPKIPTPKYQDSDLLTTYFITDFHLGAYCWGPETGDDWDVHIAKQTLLKAFEGMMAGSPNSETAIFAQMGDFLHWDGLEAVTPTAQHTLDADTRFHMLAELALILCRDIVLRLLEKHKKVRVLMCEGNHDIASSVWLQVALKIIFENNPRVEVDDTPFPFYAYQHGEIMLAFHHGHKVKNQSLPALFAAEPRYRQMWGECQQTYIHTGHLHHSEKSGDEFGGAIVERHATLSGRDAYAARGGWVSARRTKAVTYHVTKGNVAEITVTP